MAESQRFEDIYRISKVDGDDVAVCSIKFIVNQFSSLDDDLFITKVRVEHDGRTTPLITTFDFSVFKGEVGAAFSIADFMLPPKLRHCRLSIFILHTVYGYVQDKIKAARPQICGCLVERDNCLGRDRLWQKAIGFDDDNQQATFNVDAHGNGLFSGVFVDVGESWRQSIIAEKIT